MPPPDVIHPVVETVVHGLSWLLLPVLAIAAFKALVPRLLGRLGEARVGKGLALLFPDVRNDVILPDGRGGLTQIDHLALTPAGLLVVETKTYRGVILGRVQEATWTQIIGGRRQSFQNPLRQNYAHLQAVRALGFGVPVRGQVVFAGDARFPKGMPEGVCHASRLALELAALNEGVVSPELRAAWERTLSQARTDRAARKEHLSGLRSRFGGVPDRLGWKTAMLVGLLAAVGVALSQRPGVDPKNASTRAPQPSPVVLDSPLLRTPGPVDGARRLTRDRPAAPTPQQAARPGELKPAERTASIEWADSRLESNNDDCALATAAVLISNTVENRRARDRGCGLTADN